MPEQTWLDPPNGWDDAGPLETAWGQDPAVDQERSDLKAFFDDLDQSHLVLVEGKTPVRMLVHMPEPVQWAPIRGHLQRMQSREPTDPEYAAACIEAVELCVRFPEVKSAEPVFRGGYRRLPQHTMRMIVQRYSILPIVVGSWIINRYMLTDNEKKASSSESGPKTSSSKRSTTAGAATRGAKTSKAARTSAKKRAQKRQTA